MNQHSLSMVSPFRGGPPLSVVMAARNTERYVEAAIRSVVDQTFEHFEFIIVDDGSTDGTTEILRMMARQDARIVLVERPHQGMARSLNVGCALARGSLIARQDGDDISLPHRFEHQIAYMATHPEVALVGTQVEVIDELDRSLGILPFPTSAIDIRQALVKNMCFSHGSIVMRRSAFVEVGGYRTEFPIAEDYDLCLRLAERAQLENLDTVLYRYRRRTDSVSNKMTGLLTLYVRAAQVLAQQRAELGKDMLMLDRESAAPGLP